MLWVMKKDRGRVGAMGLFCSVWLLVVVGVLFVGLPLVHWVSYFVRLSA